MKPVTLSGKTRKQRHTEVDERLKKGIKAMKHTQTHTGNMKAKERKRERVSE